MIDLGSFVKTVEIAPEVHALRPDCMVLVTAVDQLINGESDETSRSWLQEASTVATDIYCRNPPARV